ncbi:hypothetical protein IscW_ISCW013152 [Ixodes scapularis]|uniref:Uncharacterized protein n=1 Tax=Ixodes scapularis TaxID=6945 RepID=B7QGA6_IXOSC|nr:hypothetical protein IscW_ISCW013152 [Ixodes scapularis]|eukprot:XP_002401374.1 hypothetical protein IscW_ISCW013152 [Ixodes scapularis]
MTTFAQTLMPDTQADRDKSDESVACKRTPVGNNIVNSVHDGVLGGCNSSTLSAAETKEIIASESTAIGIIDDECEDSAMDNACFPPLCTKLWSQQLPGSTFERTYRNVVSYGTADHVFRHLKVMSHPCVMHGSVD